MLELHFLGTGAAFYPELGNTAAFFLHGDTLYLIDCGSFVFHKLYQLSEYKEARHITVLITHMHTDHIGSLGDLIAYSWFKKGIRVKVFYPDERLNVYLKLCGIDREIYEYTAWWPEELPLGIKARRVYHDPSMGCFGYEIGDGEETIYYSGDSGLVDSEMLDGLRSGKFTHLYLDTANYAPAESGHGNFNALKMVAAPSLRGRITCIHLDCDFKEEILEAGFCVAKVVN